MSCQARVVRVFPGLRHSKPPQPPLTLNCSCRTFGVVGCGRMFGLALCPFVFVVISQLPFIPLRHNRTIMLFLGPPQLPAAFASSLINPCQPPSALAHRCSRALARLCSKYNQHERPGTHLFGALVIVVSPASTLSSDLLRSRFHCSLPGSVPVRRLQSPVCALQRHSHAPCLVSCCRERAVVRTRLLSEASSHSHKPRVTRYFGVGVARRDDWPHVQLGAQQPRPQEPCRGSTLCCTSTRIGSDTVPGRERQCEALRSAPTS